MKYEIDQSGKIEQTEKHTVLAFSNGTKGAVILSAKNKRRLQEMFRQIGAPRIFVDYVFAALLAILLKSCKAQTVTVDLEYPKSTKIIESLIDPFVKAEIRWDYIGKNSAAHDIAYKVYTEKLRVGRMVSVREIWRIVNLSGKFLKEKTGGHLNLTTLRRNRRSAPVSVTRLAQKRKKVNL